MADLGRAVISLGQLIGLLAKEGGAVQWSFFADPVGHSLSSAAGNPDAFGALQSALLDGEQPRPYDSDETRLWLPVPGMPVEAGFVWNKEPGKLQVGFGARVTIAGSDTMESTDDFSLGGLAGLVELQPQPKGLKHDKGLKHELGTVEIDGAFPSPLKFLSGGTLKASIPLGDVALTVHDTVGGERTASIESLVLAWDCVRVAIFVLRAWVRDAAAAPHDNQPIDRVHKHLFPMLGDPVNDVIKPFPLVGDKTGEQPDFTAWADSVLNTDDGAPGALTFLWHARALLTGNESGDFLGGSVYFPLAGSASSDTTTTPPPFTKQGDIANSAGAFIGIVGPPSGPRDLVLLLRPANPPEQTITLARSNPNEPPTRPTLNDPKPVVAAVNSIGDGRLTAMEESGAVIVTVSEATLTGDALTPDALQLVLAQGAPPGVRLQTAHGPLHLTADAEPRHGLAQLLRWTVAVLLRDRPTLAEHLPRINAALGLITDPLEGKPLAPLAPFAALSGGELHIG
ncbi:MAG: hypothetical protein M3N47_02435, partial [Chloroflexota bacterium]|nr:hypothetical protein [Chloroflexota bacterium]